MMRRVFVLALVLVLGAWTCAPPIGGGNDVGISTAGLAALIEGEGWHYVGETGEPAFANNWDNATSDRHLAFRIRESGIVDIQGYIENGDVPSPPSTSAIFTLPSDYYPSGNTYQGTAAIETDAFGTDGRLVALVNVSSSGVVSIIGASFDPFDSPAPNTGVIYRAAIQGQFFLTPATAP